jgi:hypothetical protein
MLMDLASDGKIIMCFYEEILEMGISIEVSFSAQQCCGGLPSKQLGCNNSCKLLLPNLSTLRTVESTISSSYGDVSWL